jgi:methionine salvage enolase-phosphatase E1
MRLYAEAELTIYITSHKKESGIVETLQNILTIAGQREERSQYLVFLNDPFDIAVILLTLSLETSKRHFKSFQHYMWDQVNKVHDLEGHEASDRARLGELMKVLQAMSQRADSHLLNCDIAIITATAIRDAQVKF